MERSSFTVRAIQPQTVEPKSLTVVRPAFLMSSPPEVVITTWSGKEKG